MGYDYAGESWLEFISTSGLYGLRPRHLLDALSVGRSTGTQLRRSLVRLCELVLNRKVQSFASKIFYGTTLTPLLKPKGGIRPVACGLPLRLLATRIIIY